MSSAKLLIQKYRRNSPRVHSLARISLNYEGHSEEVAARPPDVSARGMFISTAQSFPEGAVLNLKFVLSLSGVEIQTRCEVRYCLKGVGIGVEFVGISPDAVAEIEREIELCANHLKSRKKSARKRTAVLR